MIWFSQNDKTAGAVYSDCTRLFDSMRSITGEQEAFRLSVRDWMTGFNNEVDKFPSLALFLEMKLKELFAVPVQSEPDPYRTAVVCELHLMATEIFGRYAPLMQQLHQEMCRAIFPDFTTENKDWMGTSPYVTCDRS
eukprot:SAG31_NODE_393_length_16293_cov_15.804372_19_plen_137_part_00